MEQHDYVVAVAEALRNMQDAIAELHLPPGRSLHGPGAAETARWLEDHLAIIGEATDARLRALAPPPGLSDLHARLLSRWGRVNERGLTEQDAEECDAELRLLWRVEGVPDPLEELAPDATPEQIRAATDHLLQLMADSHRDDWEATIRAALAGTPEDEVVQVIAYLRDLAGDGRETERGL